MKNLLGRIKIAMNESGYPLKKESFHFLTKILEPQTRVERTLFTLLFHAANQSERMAANSAYLSVRFANEFLDALFKLPDITSRNEVELIKIFEALMVEYKECVRAASTTITEAELREIIENHCDDPQLSQAIWEAIVVAGLEGKIHVEDGTLQNYVIEQKSGYYFNSIKPFLFMLPKNKMWEERNAKVMIVDGIIEKVSEIDKILGKAMETKIPLLLIAHGFSEEVISTIKVNVDRKNFNIMPVRLPPDLESLNVANDIAVVAGSDIISTLKGQLICFADFDALPLVEKVRLSEKELCIENSKTRKNVSEQLLMLFEKRKSNEGIVDVTDLIDKRIQGLLASSVVLRLPNLTQIQSEHAKVRIDLALRTAKTLLGFGKLDGSKLDLSNITGELRKPFQEAISVIQNDLEKNSTIGAFTGIYFVGKTIISLIATSGLVKITSN
jgi:hypothetical protein